MPQKHGKAKRSGRKANKPAQARYTGEKRWLKNKARKQARHERELAKARDARYARARVAQVTQMQELTGIHPQGEAA